MWRKFLQFVMNRRPTKVYRVDGEHLFHRAYLFKFCGWVWYLHHYLRSDPDRGLHNHPFVAYAWVLAGGYEEERIISFNEDGLVLSNRSLHPGSINKIDQHVFHRLKLDKVKTKHGYVQPSTWSLFVCKYIENQSWGFLKPYDSIHPEKLHYFIFNQAGIAETEHGWWRSANRGEFVCKIK